MTEEGKLAAARELAAAKAATAAQKQAADEEALQIKMTAEREKEKARLAEMGGRPVQAVLVQDHKLLEPA